MTLQVFPYTQNWIPAVIAFNERLAAGGSELHFPEDTRPVWLPKDHDDQEIFQEYFVVTEGDAVRGGYVLKWQDFLIRESTVRVAGLRWPLSEGVVDPAYGAVFLTIIGDALTRHPYLFLLGMGGVGARLPQLLDAMGWPVVEVPFHFFAARSFPFLRNIRPLRRTTVRRVATDLAAVSGLGALGVRTAHAVQRVRYAKPTAGPARPEVVPVFERWADRLWHEHGPRYEMAAVRTAATLNALYPSNNERFIRLKVSTGDEVIGWVVALDTVMANHSQFGNLRVATIVDGFSAPGQAVAVIRSVTDLLRRRGAQLLISNQMHEGWSDAFRANGYLEGPSNFAVAVSPDLADLVAPFSAGVTGWLLNRGDGDGPMNL